MLSINLTQDPQIKFKQEQVIPYFQRFNQQIFRIKDLNEKHFLNAIFDIYKYQYNISSHPFIAWGQSPIDCIKKKYLENEEPIPSLNELNKEINEACNFLLSDLHKIAFYFCFEADMQELCDNRDKKWYEDMLIFYQYSFGLFPCEKIVFLCRKPIIFNYRIEYQGIYPYSYIYTSNDPYPVVFSDGSYLKYKNGQYICGYIKDN